MGEKSFWNKYGKNFKVLIGVLIVGYVIIYLCFRGDGMITTGIDLEKGDWLAFLASYMGFAGTVLISLVAILQNKDYADKESVRIEQDQIRESVRIEQDQIRESKERKKQIQPIFSIEIVGVNGSIRGVAEAFDMYNTGKKIKHENVELQIENVGEYPIRNVIIFEKYLYQLLKTNDSKIIQVAYSDSPDIKKHPKKLIEVIESEHPKYEEGIPKWFNINYDDADGNEMFQTFECKKFEETCYYSLEKIEQV